MWNSARLEPLATDAYAFAQSDHVAHSSYAGMQNRAIKSLSDADIAELRRGGGWGLALPAELKGMPDPAHIIGSGGFPRAQLNAERT